MLEQYHIILASGSPRRQELLRGLELEFDVVLKKGIKEDYPATLQGGEIPLYIAREKAAAYLCDLQENDLLITADTIVWKDGKVLGKPKTEEEAIAMINFLSGGTHQVYTGVCIRTKEKEDAF
ncbi:MAG: Maf family protein, partial [Paludibacteraceae bacterium]|nr:Maf family protein [Paludibacteraceae bacterium]